jgi:hypothetical protein
MSLRLPWVSRESLRTKTPMSSPRAPSPRNDQSTRALGFEELPQYGSKDGRIHVVLLTFQDAVPPVGEDLVERPRRLTHERNARPTGHH